jgi:hypothetical protein
MCSSSPSTSAASSTEDDDDDTLSEDDDDDDDDDDTTTSSDESEEAEQVDGPPNDLMKKSKTLDDGLLLANNARAPNKQAKQKQHQMLDERYSGAPEGSSTFDPNDPAAIHQQLYMDYHNNYVGSNVPFDPTQMVPPPYDPLIHGYMPNSSSAAGIVPGLFDPDPRMYYHHMPPPFDHLHPMANHHHMLQQNGADASPSAGSISPGHHPNGAAMGMDELGSGDEDVKCEQVKYK